MSPVYYLHKRQYSYGMDSTLITNSSRCYPKIKGHKNKYSSNKNSLLRQICPYLKNMLLLS